LKLRVEGKGFDEVVCRPCRDPYEVFEPRERSAAESTRRMSRKI
jgi:hypothetical protein